MEYIFTINLVLVHTRFLLLGYSQLLNIYPVLSNNFSIQKNYMVQHRRWPHVVKHFDLFHQCLCNMYVITEI